MDIIGRIEYLMLEAGVEKRRLKPEICKICGISKQGVYKWFEGTTGEPRATHLAMISKAYNGDLMWLITGEGFPLHSQNLCIEDIQKIIDKNEFAHITLKIDGLTLDLVVAGKQQEKET